MKKFFYICLEEIAYEYIFLKKMSIEYSIYNHNTVIIYFFIKLIVIMEKKKKEKK